MRRPPPRAIEVSNQKATTVPRSRSPPPLPPAKPGLQQFLHHRPPPLLAPLVVPLPLLLPLARPPSPLSCSLKGMVPVRTAAASATTTSWNRSSYTRRKRRLNPCLDRWGHRCPPPPPRPEIPGTAATSSARRNTATELVEAEGLLACWRTTSSSSSSCVLKKSVLEAQQRTPLNDPGPSTNLLSAHQYTSLEETEWYAKLAAAAMAPAAV